MIRRPPRSTRKESSAASDVYKRQLLRDEVGAAAVNLKPDTKPHDIYQEVADVVIEEVEKEAQTGTQDAYVKNKKTGKEKLKYGTRTLAQGWLAYGITRKVTKRNVMTLAYGSKQFGFTEQLLQDIIIPNIGSGIFTEDNSFAYAQYMSKHVWQAVRKVVVKAVEGMNCLLYTSPSPRDRQKSRMPSSA